MVKKHYVTWESVRMFIKEVATEYKDIEFSGVYGLPRGGLVLAVMLSHTLHIPLLAAPDNECLIVDDICDSGESLLHYIKNSSDNNYKKCKKVVTMYYSSNSVVTPDLYWEFKYDNWIVFPWEEF